MEHHIAILEDVSVRYSSEGGDVLALDGITLNVAEGEFLSISGPSGSGKTSLLNIISGVQRPQSGRVIVAGQDLSRLGALDLARMRRTTVSCVFQLFNLLPTLTAADNAAIPLYADHRSRREIKERVAAALVSVGLSNRADHYPYQLSGGEMQRVAIARALATNSRLILADEPTGNLDSVRGEEVIELLRDLCDREGRTVVLVTHDPRAAAYGDRMLTLRDGRVVDEIRGGFAKAEVHRIR